MAPANGAVLVRNARSSARPELFTVADLSTAWIIGDLYEKGFATVGVGTPATIVVSATPEAPLRGRVAYIDPRVDPATRTAGCAWKRVEVSNPVGTLRLGLCSEGADDGDLVDRGPPLRGRIDAGTFGAKIRVFGA